MIAIIAALGVLFLDQITKYLVVVNLPLWKRVNVIGKIMSFTHVRNRGAAFGILTNQRWFFVVIGIIVLVTLIWLYSTIRFTRTWQRIGYGLLIGGALGNLIDRVRFGYVVDFVDFHFWPVFNVADMAIVSSVLLYIVYIFTEEGQKEATNGADS